MIDLKKYSSRKRYICNVLYTCYQKSNIQTTIKFLTRKLGYQESFCPNIKNELKELTELKCISIDKDLNKCNINSIITIDLLLENNIYDYMDMISENELNCISKVESQRRDNLYIVLLGLRIIDCKVEVKNPMLYSSYIYKILGENLSCQTICTDLVILNNILESCENYD